MAVIAAHLRPVDAAVWIGSDFRIQKFNQIGCVLRTASCQRVHINDIGIDFIGEASNFFESEVGIDAGLSSIVIKGMNLFLRCSFGPSVVFQLNRLEMDPPG